MSTQRKTPLCTPGEHQFVIEEREREGNGESEERGYGILPVYPSLFTLWMEATSDVSERKWREWKGVAYTSVCVPERVTLF